MMKVESYKIKGWKAKETGMLIAENKDWILVKHIPVDYVVDGYKVYSKKFVKSRKTGIQEKKIAKVFKLKKVKPDQPIDFKFGNAAKILKWSEDKFGLFEFQDNFEDELFYGTINSISDNKLRINFINSSGKTEKNYDVDFNLKKIRSITFLTDYFESIRLLKNDTEK